MTVILLETEEQCFVLVRRVSVKITLEQIEQASSFETPELQRRAQEITRGKNTICYRVFYNDREAAFVAIDRRSDIDRLVLYELFVPRHLRRQGIGSAVLNEVEHMALWEGFSAVRLVAETLDTDTSTLFLIEWYRRRGYQIDPLIPSEMEKCVRISIH